MGISSLAVLMVFLAVIMAIAPATPCLSQSFSYTHTSGADGDGFVWDFDFPPTGLNDLPDGDTFITQDHSVNYGNFSGNPTFFDSNYLAAGNSSRIDGDAWWGNPTFGGNEIELGFFNTIDGGVNSVSFDLAWAILGNDARDFLFMTVCDSEGREAFCDGFLGTPFNAGPAFGGFDGAEGRITINSQNLVDDFTEEPFVDIQDVILDLNEILTDGGTGEFAIDNVSINGPGGGLDLAHSDIHPGDLGGGLIGTGTNRLSTFQFFVPFSFDVSNEGTGGTTFSVTLDPTSDPAFVVETPATNAMINGRETTPSGPIAAVPLGAPSGLYEASATVSNDLNASDPDETVVHSITISDPPSLSDDSGAPVQADADPAIFIANAAAGPHAGAQRAGGEVTGSTTTGAGFSVTGLETDAFVAAGEVGNGTVEFNRFGRLSSTYNGTHTVDLKMNSAPGSFLNGREPVPSVTWNLQYDLTDINADSASVVNGQSYDQQVGINNVSTAATLIDGVVGSTKL